MSQMELDAHPRDLSVRTVSINPLLPVYKCYSTEVLQLLMNLHIA